MIECIKYRYGFNRNILIALIIQNVIVLYVLFCHGALKPGLSTFLQHFFTLHAEQEDVTDI